MLFHLIFTEVIPHQYVEIVLIPFYSCVMLDVGEGNGNPLQYSCLENPRDRGAWWAAVYGVAQSRTWLKRLSSSSSSNAGCIYYILFSQFLTDGHLDYFQSWYYIIVLQWIALYICLFVFLPAYLWDRFLEVELLDQKVNTYVILLAVANKNTTPFTRVVSLYFTCLITYLIMEYVVKLLEFLPIWYLSIVFSCILLKWVNLHIFPYV